MLSRRDFLRTGAAVTAAAALPGGALAGLDAEPVTGPPIHPPDPQTPWFELGVASYSLRAFPLERVLEMTGRLGIRRLTLKDMHLPLGWTDQEIADAKRTIHAAGLELTSCGVVYMKTEEEVRTGFAYAQRAGINVLVGVPDARLLGLAEQMVKHTGIALAVHNHGPGDERYPSPESAYTLMKGMDKRMGLCLDMGHTMRLGLDPAAEAERFFDRLLDVHLKDVSSADAKGRTVEIGRGVIDIPRFLAAMTRRQYAGTLHFEFEKDEQDPLPGLAESVGYVRGVLAGLRHTI